MGKNIACLHGGGPTHRPNQVKAVPHESFWKQYLDAAPDAIFMVDEAGQIQYASAQVHRLFGYHPDELVGQSIEALLPEEVHAAHRLHRREYMRAPSVRPMSLRSSLLGQRKDGSKFPAHISLSPIFVDGEIHVLASVRDISELVEVQHKLERAGRRLQRLIEAMPDAVAVHREDRVIFVNQSLVNYLGYDSRDELVGMPVLNIVYPDDRAEVSARIAKMLETGEKQPPREERFLRKDGGIINAEVHVQPIDFEGAPALVVIGRDTTHKKELLARAMQMDRKLAVGTLASGVAHEINNPLAYAKGNVDFALAMLRGAEQRGEPLSTDEIHELTEALGDSAQGLGRIASVVSNLDTFSDPPGNECVPTNLEEVLERTLSLVFRQDTAALVVRDLHGVPAVSARRGQLAEVLVNLLTNALLAVQTDPGGPGQVRVRTSYTDGKVWVEIDDDGPGIPADVLPHVFDPFFSTRTTGEGTGLGLTIARNAIESMGGKIELQSTAGQGTRVRFWLPSVEALTRRGAHPSS